MNWLHITSHSSVYLVLHSKAMDCLSRLVEVPEFNAQVESILVNAITASPADGPATHTQSQDKGFE